MLKLNMYIDKRTCKCIVGYKTNNSGMPVYDFEPSVLPVQLAPFVAKPSSFVLDILKNLGYIAYSTIRSDLHIKIYSHFHEKIHCHVFLKSVLLKKVRQFVFIWCRKTDK